MLEARDLMTSRVVSVAPDSTMSEAADLMVAHDVGALPVLDGKRLVGIITEGDLIHRAEIGTALRQRAWWLRLITDNATLATEYVKSHSTHVADVMTSHVFTVQEGAPVTEIVDLLERKRIKWVPVMRGDELVGLFSRASLVRAIAAAGNASPAMPARDDRDIRRDVIDAMRGETWASVGTSDVLVKDGVVAFRGACQSDEERRASRILAENVAGVRGIDDRRVLIDLAHSAV
ncbi:CBS domain-containing protein [Arvimicrobium flavum]|uniref:CBS domain-containing protein n=1 Tax=Arvimicrobium flavum TaxID=3393320 RepID=UPI00237C2E37|nr:CBS domain-containing protein [Mesorhizobium shangrilense]